MSEAGRVGAGAVSAAVDSSDGGTMVTVLTIRLVCVMVAVLVS